MDGRLTRTNCNEAGDYVVPNVLIPRDLVSRPDNMDETVLSSYNAKKKKADFYKLSFSDDCDKKLYMRFCFCFAVIFCRLSRLQMSETFDGCCCIHKLFKAFN